MKAFIFVFLFIASVFGASVYEEKDDALKAINEKFDGFITYGKGVLEVIEKEKSKTDQEYEEKAKNDIKAAAESALKQLATSTLETARTAIAKGKPVAAMECIGKVALEGKSLIRNTEDKFIKIIEEVLNNKIMKMDLLFFEGNLIITAASELKNQSEEKIKQAKTGFEALKADALKKIETAKKQLSEIENFTMKISLKEEYMSVKQQGENKFKEIIDSLIKRLKSCVS